MPTYEYRCPFCQHDFEIFQRMSDDPVAACPNCGKDAVRRLSGGGGLVFKGSGFYITDYRSDSYKKAAGSEAGGGGAKSEGGGGEGKKDSGTPAKSSEGSSSSPGSGTSETKPSKSTKDE